MPDYSVIEYYVDKSIDFVKKYREYLMYIDQYYVTKYGEVQPEMVDSVFSANCGNKSRLMKIGQKDTSGEIVPLIVEGQKIWRPRTNTTTPKDIKDLETYYSIKLPDSYKKYLVYKHFCTIYWNIEVRLYPNPVKGWADILKKMNDEKRDFVLNRGLFSIGEYSDHGDICLQIDSAPEDKECKVVFVDYETGEIEPLANNFLSLLSEIIMQPEPELKELTQSEVRLYQDLLV